MSGSAVIYVRVSTEEQAREGYSIEAQEELCRAFAARVGKPVASVWRDEGLSGGLPLRRRKALRDAIGSLGRGDALVVLRLDRLYRADEHDRAEIDRSIAARGARALSTHGEGTESDRSSDVVVRGILNTIGLGEKLKIGERTREVLGPKKARGERMGQVPYGRRLGADGVRLEPDPDRPDVPALVRALRAEGRSLRAIAAELTARGIRAHRRAGRVQLGHLERLKLGDRPEDLAAALEAARAAAIAKGGAAGIRRRPAPLPSVEDLRRALGALEGRTPREALARLEREEAAAPPPEGERFPLSTIRLFLREPAA